MPLVLLHRSATEPVSPFSLHHRRVPSSSLPSATSPLRSCAPTPPSGPSSPPNRSPNRAVLPLEAVDKLQSSPSVVPRRSSHLVEGVRMATAKIKQHFHHPHAPHRLFRTNSAAHYDEPVDEEAREREKDFVCCYECNGNESMPADEVAEHPKQKEVGSASKYLKVGDFDLIKTIGTGTFARVWLACMSDKEKNQKVFALKILRKTDIIRLKQIEHIKNERNTLAAVAGHPFITTMITSFSDRDCLYMLMDYCPGGEIFTYLRRAGSFEEETARFYVAEMVLILEFLHDRQNIAYRDMKPENMLIDAEGHLKLVDFGFAKKLLSRETYTLCGTPEYLAPEVIRNTGHGVAVDWWSLGILLYEFLVGQPPFWDNQTIKIYEKIVGGHVKYPSSISADAKSLIGGLCTVNPSQRLGNIKQGGRSGAAAVKAHPFFKSVDWEALYQRKVKAPIIPKIKGPTDASNFTDYDNPPSRCSSYTKDLQHKYDHEFKDF